MPDHPSITSHPFIQPLCEAAAKAVQGKLTEGHLHPRVFDEISTFCKNVYKAASALSPVVDLPQTNAQPIAPGPSSEGYGVQLARQLVDAFGASRSPRLSMKDAMAAIAIAEKEGLHADAERIREELFEHPVDPSSLSPRERVDRAHRLLDRVKEQQEEANALLASIRDEDIEPAKVE